MAETSLKKPREELGELKIIRPSQLAKDGITGVVAEGVFEGAKPNKFDATKSDYFIRGGDGTLFILNETQSLKEQLGQLTNTTGVKVRVEYGGKVATQAGKGYHQFECFIVD